jgi:hypothetical protein
MNVRATQLRKDLYRTLDAVIETGEPVEIERKGHRLKIVLADPQPAGTLATLPVYPDYIVGDPEELVHIDWSEHWRP